MHDKNVRLSGSLQEYACIDIRYPYTVMLRMCNVPVVVILKD